MKKLFILLMLLSPGLIVFGDISSRLNLRSQDGTVNTYPYQARFTNGTITDNGDGTVSIAITGSGGGGGPSALAISSGTSSLSVIVTSPTANVVFDSTTFVVNPVSVSTPIVYVSSAAVLYVSSAPAAVIYSSTTNTTHVTNNVYTATSLAATATMAHPTDGFIVFACGALEQDTSNISAELTVFRDSTDLSLGSDRLGNVFCTSAPCTLSACVLTIDRPGDTASHTYTVYLKNNTVGSAFFPGAGWGTMTLISVR